MYRRVSYSRPEVLNRMLVASANYNISKNSYTSRYLSFRKKVDKKCV